MSLSLLSILPAPWAMSPAAALSPPWSTSMAHIPPYLFFMADAAFSSRSAQVLLERGQRCDDLVRVLLPAGEGRLERRGALALPLVLQTLQASLEGLQLTIELTPVVADDSGAFIEYAISSSKHGASQLPLVAPRRGTLLPLVTSWDRTWKERPPRGPI